MGLKSGVGCVSLLIEGDSSDTYLPRIYYIVEKDGLQKQVRCLDSSNTYGHDGWLCLKILEH